MAVAISVNFGFMFEQLEEGEMRYRSFYSLCSSLYAKLTSPFPGSTFIFHRDETDMREVLIFISNSRQKYDKMHFRKCQSISVKGATV